MIGFTIHQACGLYFHAVEPSAFALNQSERAELSIERPLILTLIDTAQDAKGFDAIMAIDALSFFIGNLKERLKREEDLKFYDLDILLNISKESNAYSWLKNALETQSKQENVVALDNDFKDNGPRYLSLLISYSNCSKKIKAYLDSGSQDDLHSAIWEFEKFKKKLINSNIKNLCKQMKISYWINRKNAQIKHDFPQKIRNEFAIFRSEKIEKTLKIIDSKIQEKDTNTIPFKLKELDDGSVSIGGILSLERTEMYMKEETVKLWGLRDEVNNASRLLNNKSPEISKNYINSAINLGGRIGALLEERGKENIDNKIKKRGWRNLGDKDKLVDLFKTISSTLSRIASSGEIIESAKLARDIEIKKSIAILIRYANDKLLDYKKSNKINYKEKEKKS